MKDRAYDQLLVTLALLAPLAMFALGKWQASLDIWYLPPDAASADTFGEQFHRHVSQWLQGVDNPGAALVVIADRECPCTKATLTRLDEALALSRREDIRLVVRDVRSADTDRDAAWLRVLEAVPATPTLLAIEGRQLLYAGPVTSGNFCTTAVSRVLGVTALQAPQGRTIFNLIDKGCYCRLPGTPA